MIVTLEVTEKCPLCVAKTLINVLGDPKVHAKKKAFVIDSNPVGQYLKFDVHEYVGNKPNVVETSLRNKSFLVRSTFYLLRKKLPKCVQYPSVTENHRTTNCGREIVEI
jgi:hypothetical protein